MFLRFIHVSPLSFTSPISPNAKIITSSQCAINHNLRVITPFHELLDMRTNAIPPFGVSKHTRVATMSLTGAGRDLGGCMGGQYWGLRGWAVLVGRVEPLRKDV